eukprot:401447_1
MSLSDSKYDAESESVNIANGGNIDMCSWSFLDNVVDNMDICSGSTSDGYTWSTFDFGSHHRNNWITSSETQDEKQLSSNSEEETEEEKEKETATETNVETASTILDYLIGELDFHIWVEEQSRWVEKQLHSD